MRDRDSTPISISAMPVGGVVDFQPLGDAPRFGWLKRLVQRGRMMGVQIVHHQHYPVFVRIVHVHQLLDHPRPIDPGRRSVTPPGATLAQA